MTALLRLFSLMVILTLGGCALGDGVAHVVKLIDKNGDSKDDTATASAPAAPTAAPVDKDPPPAPEAAPRDDIKVESLPPPRN